MSRRTEVLLIPILLSAVVALYVGLCGSKKPALLLFCGSIVPALFSEITLLALSIFRDRWWAQIGPYYGVFDRVVITYKQNGILSLLADMRPGIQFASLGLVGLIGVFLLLIWGRATVPIRLKRTVEPHLPAGGSADFEQSQSMLFVFVMICVNPLLGFVYIFVFTALSLEMRDVQTSSMVWIGNLIGAGTLMALVLVAIREEGRKSLGQMIRPPGSQYLLLGVGFPAVLGSVWTCGLYVHDRIVWAIDGWGKTAVPILSNYFREPGVRSLWYLVPALVEEFAWRGYLQPRFTSRYGLFRGLFLVGVVWGAFHFSSDFRGFSSGGHVLWRLFLRIFNTVTLSFVLGWLTIRSRSILPAALAHATYNVWVMGPSPAMFSAPWWILSVFWAIAGIILFHFFPVRLDDSKLFKSPD